ncbi:M28 family metallopeptidase [Sphingomonas radiodurans]|uniref:M28 family metallopeptidase n=1 Tax=Sphingomonas radiodurans TaxID=2890321 RepID=UPI001E4FD12A|nr:M28 family metallopeptidase [Sphingomonas radiodurans]WBH16312.1 M28 family peptidase [Sphingomonas radiodurans]
MIKRTKMLAGLLAGVAALTMTSPVAAQSEPDTAREAAFDASVSSEDQLVWMKDMASAPHHVGSPKGRANAEATLALFKQWGWDARIETFDVLFPTPISTTVEMITPERVVLGGQEPAVADDPTSADLSKALPPYVAYQGDGDVTGDLVYVNYGMPDDYAALARRGIDVKGKIVIARYGGGWRGLKPKLAQDHGAIGCIIYSDPKDDGYGQGDVYPEGGARPPAAVQRGSVLDMAIHPGDPLTPGRGAVPGAKRLDRAAAATILKIPALPMSYGDAQKLLAQLTGPVAPEKWRGGLPITYHIGGGGGVSVHLAVKSNWALTPVHNVIAKLPGAQMPDQWVVRGNHRDAWVFGASDPLSGHSAMLSEAKALGALWQQGWRPKRTIVYASWDGEEEGLLGSTEWAEAHADELRKKAVVYLNTDSNGRGFLYAAGSPSYQHLVNSVSAAVTDPQTGVSASKRMRGQLLAEAFEDQGGSNKRAIDAAEAGADLPISPLGSGSDYAAFVHHLGVPSLNVGFGGEDESGGVYHSAYDSFHHMTTFDDPGLKYGAALSKVVGRMVLRITDADLPVTRYGDFATAMGAYLGEVKTLAGNRRERDRKREKLMADGAFRLASDPLKPVGAPAVVQRTPFIEFAALEEAVDRLRESASAFDQALSDRGASLDPARRAKLSVQLRDIDQLLLDERGLPERPWYKNLAYAPGRFTGYGSKTLPGVREAIEERRFADANEYTERTAKVLTDYAARLDLARATVEGR